MVERWQRLIGGWRNVPLFLNIGWFIFRAPARMRRQDLRTFVRGLRSGTHPLGSQALIARMSSYWLWRCFQSRNTCYIRAMTLYRFLDVPSDRVRLHLGIEHRDRAHDRLHGHAWVSVDGRIIDGPPVAYEGRVREIPLDAVS